jgi:hypothetical protein
LGAGVRSHGRRSPSSGRISGWHPFQIAS